MKPTDNLPAIFQLLYVHWAMVLGLIDYYGDASGHGHHFVLSWEAHVLSPDHQAVQGVTVSRQMVCKIEANKRIVF